MTNKLGKRGNIQYGWKCILLCSLLSVSNYLSATIDCREKSYAIATNIGYAYNHVYQHHGQAMIDVFMPINPQFEMEVNTQFATSNTYAFGVRLQPNFPLPIGELYIRTQLCYNLIWRNQYQDFSAAIGLGYRWDYIDIFAGYGVRTFSQMGIDKNAMEHSGFEPHNIVYRVEGAVRPRTSKWNLSFLVTNHTDYQMERLLTLIVGVKTYYDITPQWRFSVSTLIQPVGISNLAPSFYGAEICCGIKYYIHKK